MGTFMTRGVSGPTLHGKGPRLQGPRLHVILDKSPRSLLKDIATENIWVPSSKQVSVCNVGPSHVQIGPKLH